MKEKIHPQLSAITITCACGNVIKTLSTKGKDFNVEICSGCHPYYTGKQKLIDTAGKVDQFQKRYANWKKDNNKAAEKGSDARRAPKPD